ncbi:MAG: VOC family protein [Bdellovibrionales bacterium]|nr:VOC family protein [Bdellovibrionales bacterium]
MNVLNLEKSINWYKDLFGFTVVEEGLYQGRPWSIIKKDSTMLCLYQTAKGQSPVSAADMTGRVQINHIGLRIDNYESWLDKIKNLKIKTYYDSPVKWPHSTSWYVRDPSGYEIEVAYWREGEPKFGLSQ